MSKLKGLFSFFKSVILEMKKVSWLSKKELFNQTGTVLMFVLFMMVFFAGSDYLIATVKKFIFS